MKNSIMTVEEVLFWAIEVCEPATMREFIYKQAYRPQGLKKMLNAFGWQGGTIHQVIQEATKRQTT